MLSEVAFPAVNVVNAENLCNMLSWVGGMVNISPQSLDAVDFAVRRKTIIEGAFLKTQSLWIQMVEPVLC